jgi:threonylcarbamoyladenosine tRNA methylthiotransferase MtaB
VQNGCNERCSYCIVPHARGGSRSVPLPEVLAGVERFVGQGYGEVVLTGIHLGAYGLDLSPRLTLARLLERIAADTPVPRLRLGSIEPVELDDDLLGVLAACPVICPHFHIPLQSGDDGVLQRMNRRYGADGYRQAVERLRLALPDSCIGADVIAGFPGETEDEFLRSLAFVNSLPLAYLHVFPFSPRPGTPAASCRLPSSRGGPNATGCWGSRSGRPMPKGSWDGRCGCWYSRSGRTAGSRGWRATTWR